MNGFLLLAPFFLIRFGLMAWLDHASLARAAHFAPMRGGERAAYLVYQLANAGILLYPLFLTVPAGRSLAGRQPRVRRCIWAGWRCAPLPSSALPGRTPAG